MTAYAPPNAPVLKRTPLHALHLEMGARMASFAGYDMPIQYALGVLKEHLHTRATAGLFDVWHMGQIALRPHSGKLADLAQALERLVPVDVLGLAPARQRYAFFTNSSGGIIDDLMIGHCGDHLMLIVNAGRKDVDERHLREALSDVCSVEVLEDRALLALQGPAAEPVLARLVPTVASLQFMELQPIVIANASCLVSRSGYTGEDGFEISVPAGDAERLARILLTDTAVAFVGLGARDSLRTEAGLCLYGSDINEDTTPVEAALEWAIQNVRRRGGARAGNFLGAELVLKQIECGAPRCRVGFRPRERTPIRAGVLLYADPSASESIGKVTSGGFGPSVGAPSPWATCPARCRRRILAVCRRARQAAASRSDKAVVCGASIQANITPEPSAMLKFTQEHEWVRIEGDIATVGITQHAQERLGDLVFVELPETGKRFEKGAPAAVAESVKAASDVYSPISGEVVEANQAIVADPALVNSDPMGGGWFLKLKLDDPSEVDALMDEAAYKALIS